MITGIHIENFKSLADFDLQGLGKFVCIIGVNGSGKSTLLQALDFISNLAYGRAAFRNWKRSDITTNGSVVRTCVFKVDFLFGECRAQWEGRYNTTRQRFAEEHFRIMGDSPEDVLAVREGKMLWSGRAANMADLYPKDVSKMTYEGSVVAAFEFAGTIVQDIKLALRSLGSLELLSPERLRKAGLDGAAIGIGGDGLPGFLNQLDEESVADLKKRMAEIYPEVKEYSIKRQRFGWKKLMVSECALKSPVSSDHVNDGYLRMLAMISQRYSNREFILFDEVENGINQEIVAKLIGNLLDYNGKQVMVTTHSPLVLNYLPDDVARQSVFILAKDELGHTRAKRFFDLPGKSEKLVVMGPGEIMGDTDLLEIR